MSDQIYAVLIALEGDTLLLPNTAVAEVVSRANLQAVTSSVSWLLGHCDWSGQRVPVISFEALNGTPLAVPGKRARIAIVHLLNTRLQSGVVGILTQGYPHLVTLNRTALIARPLRKDDRDDLVLSRVNIATHEAAIPDLETIEADLMRQDYMRASAVPAS